MNQRPRLVEALLRHQRLRQGVDVQRRAPVVGPEAVLGDGQGGAEALFRVVEATGDERGLSAAPGDQDVAAALP